MGLGVGPACYSEPFLLSLPCPQEQQGYLMSPVTRTWALPPYRLGHPLDPPAVLPPPPPRFAHHLDRHPLSCLKPTLDPLPVPPATSTSPIPFLP